MPHAMTPAMSLGNICIINLFKTVDTAMELIKGEVPVVSRNKLRMKIYLRVKENHGSKKVFIISYQSK